MYNYASFVPTNNFSSPSRPLPSRPLQNNSPAFSPHAQHTQPAWTSSSPLKKRSSFQPEPKHKLTQPANDDIPYGVRILLDHDDKDQSNTSSDSEETDTMPEVFPNQWNFPQSNTHRRHSEPFLSVNLSQKPSTPTGSPVPRPWNAVVPEKVSVKQVLFAPFTPAGHIQPDRRAYFVVLEGFNLTDNRRIFRIDRQCTALQSRNPDELPFIHINLWNELVANKGFDNIFEPIVYSVPYTCFRLVVTVTMSHSYEEPSVFDFAVDLRQQAFLGRDRKIQNFEVVYSEPPSKTSNSVINAVTLHVHLTNEQKTVNGAFPGNTQSILESKVLLRQLFVRLPIQRNTNPFSPTIVAAPFEAQKDIYGKRSSAIHLGREHGSPLVVKHPDPQMSPLSWPSFMSDQANNTVSNEANPFIVTQPNQSATQEPQLPPGILSHTPPPQMPADPSKGPLYRFKAQQRTSLQPIKRDPEENTPKRTNRILSTDFTHLVDGDKSPLKLLEGFAKATRAVGDRRQSSTSEGSNLSMKFHHQSSCSLADNDNSISTLNADSMDDQMPETVPEEEETPTNGKTSSDIMEEIRIEDYEGQFADFAKTQNGSKSLSKYIATAEKDALETMVKEIGERVSELILDPNASQVVQSIMQKGHVQHRVSLLQKIAPAFIGLARDKKGTHGLQTFLAHITTQEEVGAVKAIIGGYVFELSMDGRANYVIQKLINTVPIDMSQFLYQPLFDNFVQLANNSFGLLVLKQMMTKVESNAVAKQKVIDLTSAHFEKLIQNPYGNYAIQYLLEFYPRDAYTVMSKVLLKIIPYSSQKISSNVIEKCLVVCDASFRRRIVDEILKNGRLGDLMKNKYGNFVTLQLLATVGLEDKQRIMQEIQRCANQFNGTKYKTRWLKFLHENPLKINFTAPTSLDQEVPRTTGLEKMGTLELECGSGPQENDLEAVKRIWREMTKEEKTDSTPTYQGNKMQGGKRGY